MAGIINLSINLADLPKEKMVKGKKGTYINLQIGVNDETKFGNNCSAWVGQTKEERESKSERQYVGNGKVVWTDGNISVAEREEEKGQTSATQQEVTYDDDLPF